MHSRFAAAGLIIPILFSTLAHGQFTPGSRSSGDPYLPASGNGGYDVQHYDLSIHYDPVANRIVSTADITIRADQGLSEFALDLRGFTNATVEIDGVGAQVTRATDKLIVTPADGIEEGRIFHAVIDYSGVPATIIDPDGTREGWVRVSTGGLVINEPRGAMGWFPNNNMPSDKATYDFHITVTNTHTALGNGELRSKVDNGDGTTTWNWHMGYPMSSYLSTATVGRFDYAKTIGATGLSPNGNPIEFHDAIESALSAAQKRAATTNAARQEGIIKFMVDEIGLPYPFDSHGVVLHRNSQNFALEVQTKSHFAFDSIDPTLLAHEVAHQWYGNSVGPATWREIWFNEGWATWWEWYWNNKQNRNPTTVEQQFTATYSSGGAWSMPPARLNGAAELFNYFSVYLRPAMMLEAYRQIVGHSTFFALQRAILTEHAYGSITEAQFVALAKRLAEEHSGFVASHLAKLDEFFQQWLRGTTRPTLTPTAFFRQVPPRLAIRSLDANQLEIGWPTNSVRFVLEQSKDLTSTSWTPVSLPPAVVNGQAKVVLARPDGNQFYRLRSE